jgi:hypothetical protein
MLCNHDIRVSTYWIIAVATRLRAAAASDKTKRFPLPADLCGGHAGAGFLSQGVIGVIGPDNGRSVIRDGF